MNVIRPLLAALVVFPATAVAQRWTAEQTIAAGVLPLPEVLRAGAGVRRMTSEGQVVLRQSSNRMMCTVNETAVKQFDVRCYSTAFLNVMDYAFGLMRQGIVDSALDTRLKLDHQAGKITIPDYPTAGYRMLGPRSAFDVPSNRAGDEIKKWQSVHFPFRTAAELGLPTEQEGTMPFVMESGTWWSHVMIVHQSEPLP